MKGKIKAACLLVCALGALLLIPVFLSKDEPIEVSVPLLDAAQMEAQEEQAQKAAEQAAEQAKRRRMYSCTVDEDCIIVDQDPCGCLDSQLNKAAFRLTQPLRLASSPLPLYRHWHGDTGGDIAVFRQYKLSKLFALLSPFTFKKGKLRFGKRKMNEFFFFCSHLSLPLNKAGCGSAKEK